MIKRELLKETRDSEEYRVFVNSKAFELTISRGSDGEPLFELHDSEITLEPHERTAVIEELSEISLDFKARRIFGTFVSIQRVGGGETRKSRKENFRKKF